MRKRAGFKEELKRSLMIRIMLPCFLFILIWSVSFVYLIFGVISKENHRYSKTVAQEFHTIFKDYKEELEAFENAVDISEFLSNNGYKSESLNRVYALQNRSKVRAAFYIFDADNNIAYASDTDENKKRFLKEQMQGVNSAFTTEDEIISYYFHGYQMETHYFSGYILAVPIVKNQKRQGMITFVMDTMKLAKLVENADADIAFVNRYHRAIFFNGINPTDERGKLKEIFRNKTGLISDGQKYLYVSQSDTGMEGIRVFAFYDCTVYISLFFIVTLLSLFIFFLFCIVIIRSSKRFADQKTKLIYEILDGLKNVENKNLDVKLNIRTGDEFEDISDGFNIMIGSIKELLKSHEDLSRENMQAAVAAMESQFNPHFLFNTLESVRYMIGYDPKSAGKMLVDLSKLLRYSIQNNAEYVELAKEIEFSENYIRIMLSRYGSRLKYCCRIEESVSKLRVPRMILQPILENSIKYGYGETRETLNVKLCADINEEILQISVSDDGVGIEKELLEEICSNLKNKYNKLTHIGLYNVNRRVYLLHGSEYGVDVESEVMKGTTIHIRLPIQRR